ncbi:13677_t:CDS:2, partial [Gigaspora margarita]
RKEMTNYLEKFLMRDISKLYQNADDYNVLIYVGEEHNDDHGECYILRKPNISPEVFQILLSYIYTGGIPLEDDTIKSNYLNLMIAADELALGELIDHIQDHIVVHEVNWIRDNLVQIIQISSKHEACHKLQLICQEILDSDPSAIFQARDFVMLEEQALIDLLKRDDLEGKEITIWEHVIRWGLAQKPLGSEDLSEWTEEDFAVLQHTLKNCIPHIRFFHISGSDYWDKIAPYKKLLSKQLKHELKTYYITGRLPTKNVIPPQRMGAITNNKSVLICWKHFCQIASWIDEKITRYKPHEIPYTFDLLLRGSRDGLNDLNEFHQKCDNVGPTIVVIQVADLITSPERAIWNAPRNPCFSHDLQWFKGKFKQSSYEKKIYDRLQLYKDDGNDS